MEYGGLVGYPSHCACVLVCVEILYVYTDSNGASGASL
jgi:hypothetical protein